MPEGPVVRGAAMTSAAAAAADAAKFEAVQPDTVVAVLVAVPVAVLVAVPVVDDIESVDVAPVVREVGPLPQRRRPQSTMLGAVPSCPGARESTPGSSPEARPRSRP